VLRAVILAAGASTRMGRPKALLPDPDGVPFVVRITRTLRAAGLDEVIVVAGEHEETMRVTLSSEFGEHGVRLVRNPDPSRGQLSSLHAGMAAVSADTSALMVTLVDIPLVSVETVVAVRAAWLAHRRAITRPVVGTQHGHPVIFDARLFEALRRAPLEAGAKHVVRAYSAEIENVPVDDAGCLLDVDTPEDYQRLHADG